MEEIQGIKLIYIIAGITLLAWLCLEAYKTEQKEEWNVGKLDPKHPRSLSLIFSSEYFLNTT